MQLPGVKKYLSELTGLIQQYDQAQDATGQLTSLMRAADKGGDRNAQLGLEKQRSGIARQLEVVEREILESTKARDVEGARKLQIDLSLRIDAAMKAYVDWRRLVNEYEYSLQEGLFAPEPAEGEAPAGFTRLMADKELEKAKEQAEKRVAFAAAAVPERAVVLL